ncbi:hypothetical protein [Arcticibacter tournemirensis]
MDSSLFKYSVTGIASNLASFELRLMLGSDTVVSGLDIPEHVGSSSLLVKLS